MQKKYELTDDYILVESEGVNAYGFIGYEHFEISHVMAYVSVISVAS